MEAGRAKEGGDYGWNEIAAGAQGSRKKKVTSFFEDKNRFNDMDTGTHDLPFFFSKRNPPFIQFHTRANSGGHLLHNPYTHEKLRAKLENRNENHVLMRALHNK